MPATAHTSVHRTRAAMGTLFEALLLGDDAEHLAAVAEAALDEVQRIERLLSRFDPRSEISRINRLAGREEVLVDCEVAALLQTCFDATHWTERCFDILASGRRKPPDGAAAVEFSLARRLIRFTDPAATLDLGGIGKGYALDSVAEILAENGVENALMHGGTSSVLARGTDADGAPWKVSLRSLTGDESGEMIELIDSALSCSAVNEQADIIDPRTGEPLTGGIGCAVVAKSATQAEILSTALLCRGPDGGQPLAEDIRVVWLTARGET
jgi:thiamine biosynthesis lipoprotein